MSDLVGNPEDRFSRVAAHFAFTFDLFPLHSFPGSIKKNPRLWRENKIQKKNCVKMGGRSHSPR